MDTTYSDQILPVYQMHVHHFRREIMYVFYGLQRFCSTGEWGGTATAPWIQYTPCLGLRWWLLSLLGCELLVACWLLPALRNLMTCMHDTYAALSPCCLIRIYCAVRCGSGARCPLLKHSPSVSRGTFTVVILCSGFLFTERCYRARISARLPA